MGNNTNAPSLPNLIITGKDFLIALFAPSGNVYNLLTGDKFTWKAGASTQATHVIGQFGPVAVKNNEGTFKGTLSLQTGEWNSICQIEGVPAATFFSSCSIAITAINFAFAKTFSGVVFSDDGGDVGAASTKTMQSLTWECQKMV